MNNVNLPFKAKKPEEWKIHRAYKLMGFVYVVDSSGRGEHRLYSKDCYIWYQSKNIEIITSKLGLV